MKLRLIAAIALCKALRFVSRLLKRGGTAMPGRYALKICPELLSILSKNVSTVAVTGTNGKTTSARMVEEAFAQEGKRFFANRSGANLISGITTEFVMNSSLLGKNRCDYAVIECDEGAALRVFPQMKPKVVMVTNLFSDQLDRYGDVTKTLENIREGLRGSPETVMCLNADCSLTASLAGDLNNKAVFYGVEKGAAPSKPLSELADASHCIRCGAKYEYEHVNYGHLGAFRCVKCGYRRPDTDYAVTDICALGADSSTVAFSIKGDKRIMEINLPAVYNIYNAAGAVAAACEMGISADNAIKAMGTFKCGFGRMENFPIGERGAKMTLVKNPAGCNQVIDFLGDIEEGFSLLIMLNDGVGDGKDVSWIWDVEFEKLGNMGSRIDSIVAAGSRAYDLALRLKYAGIKPENIVIETDCGKMVDWMAKQEKPVFLMPNYTAMLQLREAIVAHTGGGHFWE